MSNRRIPFALVLAALAASVTWSACGGDAGPTCQPAAETCNGRDDDCDGQTDEGFDVGAACAAGVGACAASGQKVCATGGAATECNAVPGTPSAESCNQVDDDCDGQTDEGLPACCQPAATRSCGADVGVCRAGTETCSAAGAWGACLLANQPVILPGTLVETCNGLDDDCDAQTDEPDAAGCTTFYEDQDADAYGTGAGACLCAASPPFTATAAGDCDDADASVYSGAVEACNGKDDDCDAQTDEGFGLGAACTAGLGACAASGQTVCNQDGSATVCNATPGAPVAEVCNGIDDDCDGQTDEGVAGPLCEKQGGVCAGAAKPSALCQGGMWSACTDAVYAAHSAAYQPAEATCDGMDNDCDMTTDESFPALGTPCSVGTGICVATGTWVCRADGTNTICSATPGTPRTEICNGLDDDCDGQTDQGDPGGGMPCDGPDTDLCAEGVTACTGGALACTDSTGGTVDLCNGVDDDCDPASADGSEDPLVGTACDGPDTDLCAEGTRSCSSGALVCNDNTGSTLDVCNGLDDDCDPASADGSEDPQFGTACDGPDTDLCAEGTRSCSSGSLVCSDSTGSTLDVCNGVDDDCDPASFDGSEDPQFGTACDGPDTDLCAEGTRFCSGGALACNDNTGSTLDVCNGLDDDCDPASADGSEDPLVGTLCDGPDGDLCAEGTRFCSVGALACSDNTATNAELCNGIDDDCDGATDEGCP